VNGEVDHGIGRGKSGSEIFADIVCGGDYYVGLACGFDHSLAHAA
jgi:hypothetical protein